MKSLVVGAMLLHTMNAQSLGTAPGTGIAAAVPAVAAPAAVAPAAISPAVAVPAVAVPAVDAPASVLEPGINAPSEVNSLDPLATLAPLPDPVLSSDLPTGLADVLEQAASAAPFGAGSTPGAGISFGPNGWSVPNADIVPAIVAPSAAVLPEVPADSTIPLLPGETSEPPFVAPVAPVAVAPVAAISSPVAVIGTPLAAVSPVEISPSPVSQVLPPAVSAILNGIAPVAVVPNPAVVSDTAVVAPVAVDPLDTTSASTGIVDANPIMATPTAAVPVAAALPIGYNPAYDPNSPYFDPNSIYDPASPYYNPTIAPQGWEGEDNGIYEGEEGDDSDAYQGGKPGGKPPAYTQSPSYGGDDEEECPAWCTEDDYSPSYPTSTPDYDYSPYQPTPTPEYPTYTPPAEPYQEYEATSEYTPYPKQYPTSSYEQEYPTSTPAYEPYPSQDDSSYSPQEPQYYPVPTSNSYSNKVRSIINAVRRQAFNYAQPAYSGDDDDSGDFDAEDGSIPDWLYDISGAPKKATPTYKPKPKPTCPASCYKPKTSAYGYQPETSAYGYQPESAAYGYEPETSSYGYKPARPTYTKTRKGGYKTTAEPYEASPTGYYVSSSDVYYGADETTDAPYAGYTSSAWYPQGNNTAYLWPTGPTNAPYVSTPVYEEPTSAYEEPTSAYEEPTSAYEEPTSAYAEPTSAYEEPTSSYAEPSSTYEEPTSAYEEPTSVPTTESTTEVPSEPTTLLTQYQSQASPEQTGAASSDPGSPAGDYTGETLDTLCPNVCNPFNPAANFCDITTGCTTTGGSKYYCACRAGFRADNYNAKDFSKQFKVDGQPYVYLAVSTSCNTPCSDSSCSEVLVRSQCK